jgi:hypothetical protein
MGAAVASTTITAGMAVKHKSRDLMGRVRKVTEQRAVCTWVRRANLSWSYLRNLTPITDAELIAHFHQQEEMYDRIRNDPDFADIASPSVTSAENRLFLLEGVS